MRPFFLRAAGPGRKAARLHGGMHLFRHIPGIVGTGEIQLQKPGGILRETGNEITALLEGKSWTSNGYTQHTQEEEVAYVLQGEVTIDLEGEVFVLGEEDTIRILPGRKHKLYNHTDTEVKVLFVKCRI